MTHDLRLLPCAGNTVQAGVIVPWDSHGHRRKRDRKFVEYFPEPHTIPRPLKHICDRASCFSTGIVSFPLFQLLAQRFSLPPELHFIVTTSAWR